MKLKFPDLTQIHAQFENPMQLKDRAKEISHIAQNIIRKFEKPRLLGKLKERILEMWGA